MDRKKLNKIFKFVFLTSFMTFFALYVSVSSGYFEYKNSKKVALTNEQIRQFEEDVNNGKKVDIKKYIDFNNKNYQNKLSKAGLSFSSVTEKCVQKVIGESFKVLSKLVGE